MKSTIHFVLVLLAVSNLYAAKLPEYFKKCAKSKENGNCVAENIKNTLKTLLSNGGESKFKLQGLTPIHVPKIDLQATPDLQVGLSDVDFYGFGDIKPMGGGIDGETLQIKAHLPLMTLVSKYEINGRILILPIRGKGDCNITMIDFDVDYTAKLIKEERKGKTYYQVLSDDNSVLKINNVKKVQFRFENLFNGDEKLGPEMNKFMNENWKEVFAEVQVAIEQVAAYSIVNYFVNGYLHYIPIDELFTN